MLSGAGRALLLALLCAAPLTAQVSVPGFAQRSERLERALEGSRTALELRRRLGNLDAPEIPGLFLLAAEGRLPGSAPGAGARIDAEERQLVRECLSARPRRELVLFLSDLAASPLTLAQRLEAQTLLAGMGSGEHIRLLGRLTHPSQERAPIAPELRNGLRAALSSILARDPSALSVVALFFSESPPALSSAIVDAVADQRTSEASRLLATLLGRSPGLDPLLLARLAERQGVPAVRDENVFEAVRRYLAHRDPALVCAAALACGKLGDDGSVEALIGLIEHPDERVRARAFVALSDISGLGFRDEAARWTSWYHAEMRWWDEEADSLLVRVERGRGREFVRAANEALEHRLFRDRIAESFAQTLQHGSSMEVMLACRALGRLRSPVAVQALLECTESEDARLREAAWKALRAIPGVELPPESDSWAEFRG